MLYMEIRKMAINGKGDFLQGNQEDGNKWKR